MSSATDLSGGWWWPQRQAICVLQWNPASAYGCLGRVVAVVRLCDMQGFKRRWKHVGRQNGFHALLGILAEGAIALPVTLSGGVLFAS